ncbi:MAG: hypothetical protein J0I09_00370 [Sphingobacteriia bacterium]|nr:hypothetical protein [Sphingobacteriia bacterium]
MFSKFRSIIAGFVIVLFFWGCNKETSYESPTGLGGLAVGTLKDTAGNCQDIVIKGNYKVDSVLTDSNYIQVKVNISSVGIYKITTDTINGYWFSDSSYVLFTGAQTIKLKGHGKPILPINSIFTVSFSGTRCQFISSVFGSSASDYFPTSVNSSWTYNDSFLNDTVRVWSTGINAISGSVIYSVFADNYQDTMFYRKDGLGNYYQYTVFADSTNPVEAIFLKDTVPVNTTWDSPEAASTMTGISKVKTTYTIAGKGISWAVNSTTFNNVIKVQEDLKFYKNGSYQLVYTGYSYYAQGIGLIDYEIPNISSPYSYRIKSYRVY